MSQEKGIRYFRITPGTNSFLWEENVRDQNIRLDRYYDVNHNEWEQEVFCQLQVGDIVMTNWEDRYILGIGRVIGPFKRIMRYKYFKHTVPVEWFDIRPRGIPKGEKLTARWTMSDVQELSTSDFQHLMAVCQVTDDKVVKERFHLNLPKKDSVIREEQQEDKICGLIDEGKVEDALLLVTTKNIDLVTDYAQDFLARKNYPFASQFYEKVIEIDPGNLGAFNNLSFICLETGKYKEAIHYANRVLTCNPAYGCSWLNKGHALIKLGRLAEGSDCLKKAKELI